MTKKKPTTRRRRPAAKKNNLRPLFIGAAVIGGGYLGWRYLIKPMIEANQEQPEAAALDMAVQTTTSPGSILTAAVQSVSNLPAGSVGVDVNKTISPGAAGSNELKAAKIAFNDVMVLADKTLKAWNPASALQYKISKDRLQGIADLRKGLSGTGGLLDVNTGYGSYTEKVVNTILGKSKFNLNDVRNQRSSLYAALGLNNPY
jgi:hypothetical protein